MYYVSNLLVYLQFHWEVPAIVQFQLEKTNYHKMWVVALEQMYCIQVRPHLVLVLHWSICNANLQWCDVARKIVLVEHPVADDCLRYLQCCNALQGFESDSKTCSKCNMSANSCEKHALRIGVASWRCKLTTLSDVMDVWWLWLINQLKFYVLIRTVYGTSHRVAYRQSYRDQYYCCAGWQQQGNSCPVGECTYCLYGMGSQIIHTPPPPPLSSRIERFLFKAPTLSEIHFEWHFTTPQPHKLCDRQFEVTVTGWKPWISSSISDMCSFKVVTCYPVRENSKLRSLRAALGLVINLVVFRHVAIIPLTFRGP